MTPVDVLAIGPHPDDIELGCGATLAKLARSGRRVGLVHLTRGEAGTRGSAAERRREAESAAEILGAAELAFLDCGDGAFRSGLEEENALIDLLRSARPEVVFAPPSRDRHPDHGRAHRLAVDASFYAGLARRGAGAPHRPAALFTYMLHLGFEPAFVVDVTSTWEIKMAALDAYATQLAPAGAALASPSGPATKIASPEFRAAIEGRARHYGNAIGVALGEGFGALGPLAIDDPFTLLARGAR